MWEDFDDFDAKHAVTNPIPRRHARATVGTEARRSATSLPTHTCLLASRLTSKMGAGTHR